MKIPVKIKKLANFRKNTELSYGSKFSSGLDLIAAIDSDIVLPKMERVLIPAGISIEMPIGYEAQVEVWLGIEKWCYGFEFAWYHR